jgi:ABC-type antimicrobial peptide transport system permease subunit
VRSVDPRQPVTFLRPLSDDWIDQVYPQRISAIGLSALAGLALLLAVAGIFGVTAYTVRRRVPEFGLRLALGATPRQLQARVLAESARLHAAGCVLGLIGAVGVNRLVESVLFEVHPADPATLFAVGGLLTAAALSANWLASRAATAVDPAEALRRE